MKTYTQEEIVKQLRLLSNPNNSIALGAEEALQDMIYPMHIKIVQGFNGQGEGIEGYFESISKGKLPVTSWDIEIRVVSYSVNDNYLIYQVRTGVTHNNFKLSLDLLTGRVSEIGLERLILGERIRWIKQDCDEKRRAVEDLMKQVTKNITTMTELCNRVIELDKMEE